VIERITPTNTGTTASPQNIDFSAGEVVRMKVYEQTADIHKEAFVREEVKIRKEIEQDTVETEETLRREELILILMVVGLWIKDLTGAKRPCFSRLCNTMVESCRHPKQ
jgi:hypothetical protein